MLTIVDEFSLFPFAFLCPNTTSATVMKCLYKRFVLCGTPSYVHSDRGSSYLPKEIKEYFSKRGICTSKNSPYHHIGNGQSKRYDGIIWKGVPMALRTQNLSETKWGIVLPNVLHSIRSVLSTATSSP